VTIPQETWFPLYESSFYYVANETFREVGDFSPICSFSDLSPHLIWNFIFSLKFLIFDLFVSFESNFFYVSVLLSSMIFLLLIILIWYSSYHLQTLCKNWLFRRKGALNSMVSLIKLKIAYSYVFYIGCMLYNVQDG
jgi:hypothetical protein